MKEYVGMVLAQVARVLVMIVSKSVIADGMSNYSFIFYSNAIASLILLPLSLIFHKYANRPQLSSGVICGLLILGLLGFLGQLLDYSGITYSSATLATTLMNLVPGFTFILAILCRMEAINIGSLSTKAKFVGTVVTIAGAIIMTLYKGPTILSSSLKSEISNHLLVQPSNWLLGGILLSVEAIFTSMSIILLAIVLKKYPAVMIVLSTYCVVCAIFSALAALIMEDDPSSFSLLPKKRLFFIIYSGIFGSAFHVTVIGWCLQRRGPLFVATFQPVGIVISSFIGVIFLGDGFYLGSLLGSNVIVLGFYTVMWGKSKEEKSKLDDEGAPLLQDVVEEQIASPSPLN